MTSRRPLASWATGALFAGACLVATASRAEVVVLECGSGPAPDLHEVIDIDFANSTVRKHAVLTDGRPAYWNGKPTPDDTYPAQITPYEVRWTVEGKSWRYEGVINRYTLVQQSTLSGQNGYNTTSTCHRFTPPSGPAIGPR